MPRTRRGSRRKRAKPLREAVVVRDAPSSGRGNQKAAPDEYFMRECLGLAHDVLGLTSPNPAVGCVIVRKGVIVGRGATAAGGRPHAETQALTKAGARARGATAYVSFEPCAHFGKTPPCARALVEAGVSRAVIGCVDPYPPVRGRGVAILKLAVSLDGRIAASGGDSRWISSEASRELVHRWRREADAVMVGAATVIADDPRLTCRIEGGRDPARVIVDGRLRCPPDATVFRQRSTAPTILVTTPENRDRAKGTYGLQGETIIAIAARGGRIALADLMRELARRGWSKVLIEGGAHLAGSALAAGVVDRVAFFVAPRIIGNGLPAVEGLLARTVKQGVALTNFSARRVGEDWLLEADVARRGRTHRSR